MREAGGEAGRENPPEARGDEEEGEEGREVVLNPPDVRGELVDTWGLTGTAIGATGVGGIHER